MIIIIIIIIIIIKQPRSSPEAGSSSPEAALKQPRSNPEAGGDDTYLWGGQVHVRGQVLEGEQVPTGRGGSDWRSTEPVRRRLRLPQDTRTMRLLSLW